MNKLRAWLKVRDYRHYICYAITALFIGCGVMFPNAIPRLAETLRDLALSIAYYFLELFSPGSELIHPTVNDMPSWSFTESPWKPLTLFPYTWEEFEVLWAKYWRTWASKENLLGYLLKLGDVSFYASRYGMILLMIGIVIWIKLRNYTAPVPKPKRAGDSAAMKCFEKLLFALVYPIVAWIKDFVLFLKENKRYYQLWIALWVLYFNVASMAVAFLAYYFYFAVSFDFLSLYTQVIKLMTDLAPAVGFLPKTIWFTIGTFVYNYICRSMAFARLYYYERANRAFLSKRGIVTTVYGKMGTGKTQLITSMALSAEIEQWDNAFEVMLESDLKFPNFPWYKLRLYLNKAVATRDLCDLDQVRARMQTYRRGYDYVLKQAYTPATWKKYRWQHRKSVPDYTFGYDFEHYASTYNDELKISHLYDAIEDYACAYLVYTVQTSLIFANYSIRVDSIIRDVGNMPERNTDFFKRDPRLMDSYSRHCHIVNFDMLRLGKRMRKAFKLSFGVYVVTEIDKERKNALELRETKKNVDECNQNNDLFNACLMMCRHAAVIANRVFIRIICDLQRPEAWGAGGRELGEVIYIKEQGDLYPTLPVFSPFWLFEGLFLWFKGKWKDFESKYDVERRDRTLFDYLFTNITSKINNHYDKVNGLFGAFELKLELQSGRLDGEVKTDKWRILTKKDRSKRYKTDCLSTVFNAYEPVRMHIDDFISYAGSFGTLTENGLQESFFQNDLRRMDKVAA